jgi:dTDP-4-dehydrorhamnose reductase
MKVLILGHKGMLGSDLLNRLSVCHDVTGQDIQDIDITVKEACQKALSEIRPDVVINAAAYTNVDGCESDKEKCFLVNAEAVKNIALACLDTGTKIVHISTDYVFDGEKKTPYLEDDICNPVNVYGQSKLMGEMYLQELSRNFILVRSSWLFGKNGKNFVKTIADKIQENKRITVVDDQIGSPTFTWDLAGAIQLLIEKHHTGVFHVANQGSCSWYEFASKIVETIGATDVHIEPIKSDELIRPASRPHYSVLNCRKFIETSGKTMRDWKIALDDFIGAMGYSQS